MSEQPLRILLAANEASLRERLATYLQSECGHSVEIARTGAEMLARIDAARGQYDLALIDDLPAPQASRGPEPLGITLTTEIRKRYSNIECILFTGRGMHSRLDALRAGAYRYICKPFDPEELAFLIWQVAEYRRLKHAACEKQALVETSTAPLGETELRKEQLATRDTERRARQLEQLHQASALMSAALDFDAILQITLSRGLQAIRTDEGSIMLVNPTTNELEMKAWIVQGEFIPSKDHRNFANGEGITGHVVRTCKAYNCPDCQRDPYFVASFTGRNPCSLLSVPIVSYGRVLGTINADSQEMAFFTSDDMQFLSALADHLAVVIESQRLRDFGMIISTLTLDEMLGKNR